MCDLIYYLGLYVNIANISVTVRLRLIEKLVCLHVFAQSYTCILQQNVDLYF